MFFLCRVNYFLSNHVSKIETLVITSYSPLYIIWQFWKKENSLSEISEMLSKLFFELNLKSHQRVSYSSSDSTLIFSFFCGLRRFLSFLSYYTFSCLFLPFSLLCSKNITWLDLQLICKHLNPFFISSYFPLMTWV